MTIQECIGQIVADKWNGSGTVPLVLRDGSRHYFAYVHRMTLGNTSLDAQHPVIRVDQGEEGEIDEEIKEDAQTEDHVFNSNMA